MLLTVNYFSQIGKSDAILPYEKDDYHYSMEMVN